jgi:hypothetical protein
VDKFNALSLKVSGGFRTIETAEENDVNPKVWDGQAPFQILMSSFPAEIRPTHHVCIVFMNATGHFSDPNRNGKQKAKSKQMIYTA